MGRTQIEKLWLLGAAVVGLLVVVIGWFFFIAPQRDQTSQVDGQVADAQLQNDSMQQRLTALAAQNKDLATYKAQLARAQQALPTDSGLPDFLRTLQRIGSATTTDVVSLSVGAITPVNPVTPAVPTATDTASASSAPTAAPTVAPVASVYALPISAQVNGSLPRLREFLTQLQKVQPRAVLVEQAVYGSSGGNSGGTSGGGQGTLQLTLQAFVAPPASALAVPAPAITPAAVPAAPTPSTGG